MCVCAILHRVLDAYVHTVKYGSHSLCSPASLIQVDLPVSSPLLGVPDEVNVEESLSPLNLSVLKEQRSLLAERLRNTSLRTHAGLPSTPLIDFSELNMPRYCAGRSLFISLQKKRVVLGAVELFDFPLP